MIAAGEELTQMSRDVLAVVVLVLLAFFSVTLVMRVLEAVSDALEERDDAPLLFVRAPSPESIRDLVERLCLQARRLLEPLLRCLRPSAAKVEVHAHADTREHAGSGDGANDAEARGDERERSAVFEVDAARVARDGLEVRGADVPTDAASTDGQVSDFDVGHAENLPTGSEGGEW